ncbi:MAG: hypothetical protein CSYNP_03004 [Syntrophus sp. SKADARSKE-3]|nr:hypothetical protein [Syntrophus sp. SKADARSKE-3]
MSIIDAIQDYLSGPERTYYRKVGKLTINFCKRASNMSVNENQRRLLMTSAVSADEVVAALLGLDQKRNAKAFKDRRPCSRLNRGELLTVMRSYLSALLILCATFKEIILAKTEMEEKNFMESWRSVFEYSTADMQIFDEKLSPSFRSKGVDGLVEALGRQMADILFQEKHPLCISEALSLRNFLLDDVAAIKKYVEKSGSDI